ncbi:MAG: ABC transporter permease [Ktedonobacterales bacterium]
MSQVPVLPPSPMSLGQDGHKPVDTTARLGSVWTTVARLPGRAWRMVTLNRKVTAGCGIIGFFLLVAIVGPLFIHPGALTYTLNINEPPSSAHWLGTNQGGQDVFSQLVLGTRASLAWAFLTGFAVVGISVTVGLASGYFGGITDDALSLVTNVFLVIPSLPLAIVAVQFFSNSTLIVALVVALTNWPWGARVLRAQTLSMRNREFITAARASGERTWRIIAFEVLPNEFSIVAASFVTTTIQVLLAVAGLQFLGFGNSTEVSWGTMLYAARNSSALLQGDWWWFAPPGLCIAVLGMGLALLNFGIDELADPRLRSERSPKRLDVLKGLVKRKVAV